MSQVVTHVLTYRNGAEEYGGFWKHPVGRTFGWTIRIIAILGVGLFVLVVGAALAVWIYYQAKEATWSRGSEAAAAGLVSELGTLGPQSRFHPTNIAAADKRVDGSPRQTWYAFKLPPAEVDPYVQSMQSAWTKARGHSLDAQGRDLSHDAPGWWDGDAFERGTTKFTLQTDHGGPLFQVSASSSSGLVMIHIGQ
jgi:hypothetical protein